MRLKRFFTFSKKIRRPTTAVTDGLHPLLDISPKNVLVCKGCSCSTQDMNIGLKNQVSGLQAVKTAWPYDH